MRDLSRLDIDTLRDLYSKESSLLERALLHGASWKNVEKQRNKITELSLEIYKKLNAHPAEGRLRS